MKRTRLRNGKSKRPLKNRSEQSGSEDSAIVPSAPTASTASTSVSAPLSISGMLQVVSETPTIKPHYPTVVSDQSMSTPSRFEILSVWRERLQNWIDQGRTFFTRPVRRRRRVQRSTVHLPVQARRKTDRSLFWQFQRLRDVLGDAWSYRTYVPWAVSVAVATFFIWREPIISHGSSATARSQLDVLDINPPSNTDSGSGGATAAIDGSGASTDASTTPDVERVAQELSQEASDLAVTTANDPFVIPAGLRPAVAFWQRVFGVWGSGEAILHDSEHLNIVYSVMQLPDGSGGARLPTADNRVVEQQKRRLCAVLNDLEYRLKRRQGLTHEQSRLLRLLTLLGGRSAVKGAASRVRIQRGMRTSFRQGLAASGRYEKAFRQVFRESGMPEDLVYLAHVESAFTRKARSPAGAVGVWQFMPETGRRFLRIDRTLDERYDPVFATRGAARYLALAHDKLDDWGLTITSFNYGLTGMLNAKAECGQNIDCVVHRYDGPSFGFASRNYYAEFLAIRSIIKNLKRYFPDGVEFAAPLDHKRVRLARAVLVQDVARVHGLTLQDLIDINPALTSEAAEGRIVLSPNTEVWLPEYAVVKDVSMGGMIATSEDNAAATRSH